MTDFIKPTIKHASFSCPCSPGTDVAHQPAQPEPSEEWPEFPGPLMHAQMDKDVLFRFIRWKAQRCLQQIHESDQVEEYFFWQIMELFCFRNKRLMMCEVACLLLQCYMLLRKKTSKHKGAKRGKEWCIPLAQLLCMSAPDDELREAVVKMGDDLASRGLTYAAHICYVVVKMELGSHTQFELIGCDSRMPFGLIVLSEAIMRTETYEYVLSLISGLAQPSFQVLKLCQASRLAYFDLAEGNSCGVAQKYCETIARAAMAFPDKITHSFIERLILVVLVSFNLLEEKAEEPEWLLDLQELHKIKLIIANANGEPDQQTVSTSHEVVSESQDPLQAFDQEWHTDPEALFNARYTVQEPLGTGGFGSVYAGVREKDGKQVAIKFVNKKKLSNTITIPGEMQVLPLEVALMKMVSKAPRCNNVVELLEWFDLGIKYIMVLERPGACMDVWEFATLHDHCLSEGQAKDIMLQVVWAARHCCDRGVVHFDIKAENLLINTDTMEVKLIDFGAGELLKDSPYQSFSGTKGYEPPEWLINEEYKGIPATIWGLGILMYYLVCGYYPFESKEDFFTGHLELRPDMSRECFDLMMWCLDLNPEMRPGFNILLRHEWFTEAVHSK